MTIDPIAIDGNVHRMTTRSRSRFMKNRNQSGDISGGYLNKSKTDDLSSAGFIPHRICRDDNFRGDEMVRKEDDRVSKDEILVGVEEIAFVSIPIIATLVFSETPLIWIWTIGIFIIIINCVFGKWDENRGYDEGNRGVYGRSEVFERELRILDGRFRF
mgnify:FL=1|jgi:hypothetical protein